MLIMVPLLSQTQRDLADIPHCFAHSMLNRLGRKDSAFPKTSQALHQDDSYVGRARCCLLQPGCSSFRLWKGGSSSFLSNRICFGLASRVMYCLESLSGAFPSPLSHCSPVASVLQAVAYNVLVRLLLLSEGVKVLAVLPISLFACISAAGDRRTL